MDIFQECKVLDNQKLKNFIKENINYTDPNYRLWSVKLDESGRVVKDEDIDTLTPDAERGFHYKRGNLDWVKIRHRKPLPRAFVKIISLNEKKQIVLYD